MMPFFLVRYFLSIGESAGHKRNAIVSDMLPRGRKHKYLDVGCQDGELTIFRARAIGTGHIWGVDVLRGELAKAKKRGIHTVYSDLNGPLRLGSEQFDVVTATQVIEHLTDVDVFLSEIYRVLKKGGVFVLSTENLAAWHNIAALMLGMQPSAGPHISRRFMVGFQPLYGEHIKTHKKETFYEDMEGHNKVMAYRALRSLVKSYHFRILEERGVGYYPFPPPLADVLASLDTMHALDIILKLQKV